MGPGVDAVEARYLCGGIGDHESPAENVSMPVFVSNAIFSTAVVARLVLCGLFNWARIPTPS